MPILAANHFQNWAERPAATLVHRVHLEVGVGETRMGHEALGSQPLRLELLLETEGEVVVGQFGAAVGAQGLYEPSMVDVVGVDGPPEVVGRAGDGDDPGRLGCQQ